MACGCLAERGQWYCEKEIDIENDEPKEIVAEILSEIFIKACPLKIDRYGPFLNIRSTIHRFFTVESLQKCVECFIKSFNA